MGDTLVPQATTTLFLDRRPSPIGTMLVVSDEQDRVRALDWPEYEERMHRLLQRYWSPGCLPQARPLAAAIASKLDAYFAGDLAALDTIPVNTGGTVFQREVWEALRAIPAGSTLSYGALAVRLGRRLAVRAVGMANGANPVGVVVPCHRVIGADASLTGYGGGLARKRWLLAHEGATLAV